MATHPCCSGTIGSEISMISHFSAAIARLMKIEAEDDNRSFGVMIHCIPGKGDRSVTSFRGREMERRGEDGEEKMEKIPFSVGITSISRLII